MNSQDPGLSINGTPASLKEALSQALPPHFRCKVRYIRTRPSRCDALFSPPPGSDPEKTRSAHHFLTVSIDPSPTTVCSDVLVFGIEVLVYHTKDLTTIFVSKADSTGYLPQQRPSPTKQTATAFLRWLSTKERHKHPKRELVISLFARSQSQYLFPGSDENSQKHVLDDRQLIKWWARVLDPLLPRSATNLEYNGYITVPGYEDMEVRPFFPPSAQVGKQWHPGNPLAELAETRGLSRDAPPRCLLPRFPDDPKARFMGDLDEEVGLNDDTTVSPTKRKNGRWGSIWSLGRFWEGMEFRQECSSGRMVGFLWLVIRDPETKRRREHAQMNGAEAASQESVVTVPSSEPPAEKQANGHASPPRRRRTPLTGPIIPRQPRLKGGSSSLTASSGLQGMVDTVAEDGLVLSQEGYDQTLETMLRLDFANPQIAAKSTATWVNQVSSIYGAQADWSLDITGTLQSTDTSEGTNGIVGAQVNNLGAMVRKKRKATESAVSESHAVTETRVDIAGTERPAVNVLSGGIMRKKPKA